jgi:hypothetical protein
MNKGGTAAVEPFGEQSQPPPQGSDFFSKTLTEVSALFCKLKKSANQKRLPAMKIVLSSSH